MIPLLIGILTIVLNILQLWCLHKQFRRHVNPLMVIIFHLSVADLLQGASFIPTSIFSLLEKKQLVGSALLLECSDVCYQASIYLSSVSIVTLATLTVLKMLRVTRNEWLTKRTIKQICKAIWIVVFGCFFTEYVVYKADGYRGNVELVNKYRRLWLPILTGPATIIFVFCFVKMFYAMRTRMIHTTNELDRRKRRFLIIAILNLLAFLVCVVPLAVLDAANVLIQIDVVRFEHLRSTCLTLSAITLARVMHRHYKDTQYAQLIIGVWITDMLNNNVVSWMWENGGWPERMIFRRETPLNVRISDGHEQEGDKDDEQKDGENTRTQQQKRRFWRQLTPIAVIMMLLFAWTIPTGATPDLGPLYNCDESTYLGVYALTDPLPCLREPANSKVKTFKAMVKEYRLTQTTMKIFHCSLIKVTLNCKENFFGAKDRQAPSEEVVPIPKLECQKAATLKRTIYGNLQQVGHNRWRTAVTKQYSCSWMKETVVSFYKFTITEYPAILEGDDRKIHQSLTTTKCIYNNFFCKPVESPHTEIVWKRSKHKFRIYKELGIYPIKQIQDFFLVASLGIGGTLVEASTDDINFLLDTGYIIQRRTDPSYHEPPSFKNLTNKYVKSTRSSSQRDIYDAHLTRKFIYDHELTVQMSRSICMANKEIRNLQKWIIGTNIDMASEYLFPSYGKMVTSMGDGLLLHQCKEIIQYTILWRMEYNGTCYKEFPVVSHLLPRVYFLELATRRLTKKGQAIDCNNRPSVWYVKDKKNSLWRLKDGNFTVVKKYKWRFLNDNLRVIKLGHFSKQILHYHDRQPSRTSLLSVLMENKENLEALASYRDHGDGDIIRGIGKLVGSTISAAAQGSSQIIKTIGHGIKETLSGVSDLDRSFIGSIGNATVGLVDSSTSGVAKILDAIGGVSGLVLYVLVLLLYIYTIYNKIRENGHQIVFKTSPTNRKRPLKRRRSSEKSPPISPHRNYAPPPVSRMKIMPPSPVPGPLTSFLEPNENPERVRGRRELTMNPMYESMTEREEWIPMEQ